MSEPNLINKAKNLTSAVINWAAEDGFERVPPTIFYSRKQFCLNCPYWNPEAFLSMGGCKLCGCSVAKLYIPSCQCPDNPPRWLKAQVSDKLGNVPSPCDTLHTGLQ
jgi:hypothetical protein